MSAASPRKPSVGMTQNFISLDSPESVARSSRQAIKTELVNKLAFDDPTIFQHLRLDRVPPTFVNKCTKALGIDGELRHATKELQKITNAAAGKRDEDLEAEENDPDEKGGKVKKKAEEKKMYPHLTTIFDYIQTLPDSTNAQLKSQFVVTGSTVLKADSSHWGFPKASPDFTLLDATYNSKRADGSNDKPSVLWRHRTGFCEIKPTSRQGPNSNDPRVVKPLVSQSADYARLHLSARPFQLFSIGLLIFGSKFCVAIFDRAGVKFSPEHDMWTELSTFVRVVRCLTCHMSPTEFGQDPTVRVLSNDEQLLWKNNAKPLGVKVLDDFPTYAITMGGISSHCWYTIGLPIWTSISLLGRGTAIWRVCEQSSNSLLVLKNAWRSGGRTTESEIYQSIHGSHLGVADYRFGGDVMFPGNDNRPISVSNLRGTGLNDGYENPVLHRVLVATLGRPLWEYRSELELVKGLRGGLEGHQFLCTNGILHRDISAGNILLPAHDLADGREGFLMDLEFAHLSRASLDTTVQVPVAPIRTPGGFLTEPTVRTHIKFDTTPIKRGAAMTGTAQFMAFEILEAIVRNKAIAHEPRHDIESFIWVLCYSLTRRLVHDSKGMDKDSRTALHEFFHTNFGRMTVNTISLSRRALYPLALTERFPELLSPPMVNLLATLHSQVQMSALSGFFLKPVPLSHDALLAALNNAIGELSKLP